MTIVEQRRPIVRQGKHFATTGSSPQDGDVVEQGQCGRWHLRWGLSHNMHFTLSTVSVSPLF